MKLHFGIVFQSSNFKSKFNHENYVKSVSFYMFDHVFGHNSVKNDFKSDQYLRSNKVCFENSFDRVMAKYTIKHINNLQTIENLTD